MIEDEGEEPREQPPVVEGPKGHRPAQPELDQRLLQQALVARLGLFALGDKTMQEILDEAVKLAAEGLKAPYAKVLEFLPMEGEFVFRAVVGWPAAFVGVQRLTGDPASPAGFAYKTKRPVISNELDDDDRFVTPPVLAESGIRRAINVILRGEGASYGVLEVDSPDGSAFCEDDLNFMQALGNALGVAIEKEQAGREIERLRNEAQARAGIAEASEARYRSLTEAMPSMVWTAGDRGSVHYLSRHWVELTGAGIEAGLGSGWLAFIHPDDEDALAGAWRRAIEEDEGFSCEHRMRVLDGSFRWCLTRAVPFRAAPSGERQWVGTTTDIDAQKRAAADLAQALKEREELLAQKEVLIREIDHRVKNSLMLSRSLLSMQAKMADTEPAREQLQAAANRLLTVARVHDRLYRHETLGVVDLGRYIHDLCTDIAASLGLEETHRGLRVEAGEAIGMAPVTLAVPLGLIVTELVTNSVKHGSGEVSVELTRLSDATRRLTVGDEGASLKAEAPLPQGLGTSLVTMLARQLGGELQRVDGHTALTF